LNEDFVLLSGFDGLDGLPGLSGQKGEEGISGNFLEYPLVLLNLPLLDVLVGPIKHIRI
jgi:hypothetical protein